MGSIPRRVLIVTVVLFCDGCVIFEINIFPELVSPYTGVNSFWLRDMFPGEPEKLTSEGIPGIVCLGCTSLKIHNNHIQPPKAKTTLPVLSLSLRDRSPPPGVSLHVSWVTATRANWARQIRRSRGKRAKEQSSTNPRSPGSRWKNPPPHACRTISYQKRSRPLDPWMPRTSMCPIEVQETTIWGITQGFTMLVLDCQARGLEGMEVKHHQNAIPQ